MTQYGKITAYDTHKGSGMITPQQGGQALPFDRSGLQQQAQQPRQDQLYSFDAQEGDSGQMQATNLQMEQSESANQQDGAMGDDDRSRSGIYPEGTSDSDQQNGRQHAGGSTFQPLEKGSNNNRNDRQG